MLSIDKNNQQVIIRKSVLNEADNYTMIVQHDYTRKIAYFTVEDISQNDLYYKFNMAIPGDFPYGEYTYYITPYNGDLAAFDFNYGDMRKSRVFDLTKYNPICISGIPIGINNVPIVIYSGEITEEYEPIKILQSGVLQYFDFEKYTDYKRPVEFEVYERTK